MPTFWKGYNIIHFAANKKHIGLYAGEEAVIVFEERLKTYKTSKGTIQIPYKEPLPLFQFILGACKGSFFRCGKAGGERGIQNPGDYS